MRQRYFDFLAIAGIFVAYSITIRVALRLGFVDCLLGGVANTIPVVIFGAGVRRIVIRRLIGRSVAIQLMTHLLLCAAFVCLSYFLLIVLLGLFNAAGWDDFVVRPFSTAGAAWQSLENVTTYALIVVVSHLRAEAEPSTASHLSAAAPVVVEAPEVPDSSPSTQADTGRSRYFVRVGEELRPLDIDTVVSIVGADDYAEVRTLSGKHLVRVTLAEFGKSLDPAKYVRVHRSWIVNIHRVASAEAAGGGRLLLHMETGETISTSRAGAKLVRDRVL